MLNEDRVKHMTHMAMFEKREAKKLQPMMRYSKRDYVNLCVILNIFLGTALYLTLCVAVVSVLYSTLFVNLHAFGLILGIVLMFLVYVVFLYFFLNASRKRHTRRYEESIQAAKELRREYRILEQMYEEEETQKIPEGWY